MKKVCVVLLCLILLPRVLAMTSPVQNGFQGSKWWNDLINSFSSSSGLNITRIQESFTIPNCLHQCLPSLDTFSTFLRDTDFQNSSTIRRICGEVNSISQCASQNLCSARSLEVASNAVKFMCVDNESIPEAWSCLTSSAPKLTDECARTCNFSSTELTNKTVHLNMKALCDSSVCLLQCGKSRLARQCKLGDNSIVDAIIDNVLSGQGNGLDNVFGFLLPDQCKEIVRQQMNMSEIISKQFRPFSVGKPAPIRGAPAPSSAAAFTRPIEKVILVNNQLRTLQCQLLDVNNKPLETPSFEKIAKLISSQDKVNNEPQTRSVPKSDVLDNQTPSMRTEDLPGLSSAGRFINWLAVNDVRVPLETKYATTIPTLSVFLFLFIFLL